MEKVNMSEFVRQISQKSGYAQTDIKAVLNFASECIAENLSDGLSTTIMQGVVIYPSVLPARDAKDKNGNLVHYEQTIYPRARFGQSFKKLLFS